MRRLKDELREQNGDCTMEELREFLWRSEIGCALMMAFYFDRKPYLYTLNFDLGIANKVNSHCRAIGCGANLGEYLLGEHAKREMVSEVAYAVAIYTIETVKKHDAFCGGPTRIALMMQPPDENAHFKSHLYTPFPSATGEFHDVFICDEDEITALASAIMGIDEATKLERNHKIANQLEALGQQRIRKLIEKYT
jgi:hypothetical protein